MRLFIHCLLKANHKQKDWHGIQIRRGQFVTSLSSLSKELRISERSIRTSIKRLKMTGEVTDRTTNRFRLITITHYDDYQSQMFEITDKTTDKLTGKRRKSDRQAVPYQEEKKRRIKKENTKEKKVDDFEKIKEAFAKVGVTVRSKLAWWGNYEKWRIDFTLEQIVDAIENIPRHRWLKTIKVTPVIFFRTNQDWIEQCLALSVGDRGEQKKYTEEEVERIMKKAFV